MASDLATLLEQRARQDGDRPFFLRPGGVSLTFAQFNERANQLARGRVEQGATSGAAGGGVMRNSTEFALASYALKKLGAIEVAVNTEVRGTGLQHMLDVAGCELLLCDPESLPALLARDATAAAPLDHGYEGLHRYWRRKEYDGAETRS